MIIKLYTISHFLSHPNFISLNDIKLYFTIILIKLGPFLHPLKKY